MASHGRLAILRNQKGIALVYVAIMIFALFGMLGLAVDLSHLYVVRGELQNAADAAALAGAWSLYKDPLNPTALPTLDFERARTAATNFIAQNKTDGVALAVGAIEVGYWPPLNPDDPLSTTSTAPGQAPAVRVTVARADGSNGGPVDNFFIKVLDSSKSSSAVSSRPALATSGYPSGVAPNTLFPMALSKCMTDDIFGKSEADWPNPIYINSPYGPGGAGCYSGQWTSFKVDDSDVPAIRTLMEHGNPEQLKIDDSIYMEPGVKASLYQTDSWIPPLPPGGMDVVMAVVETCPDGACVDLTNPGGLQITGFATFHIDGTVATGSTKQIYGHFVSYSQTYLAGSIPGGPESNTVTPPKLVQ